MTRTGEWALKPTQEETLNLGWARARGVYLRLMFVKRIGPPHQGNYGGVIELPPVVPWEEKKAVLEFRLFSRPLHPHTPTCTIYQDNHPGLIKAWSAMWKKEMERAERWKKWKSRNVLDEEEEGSAACSFTLFILVVFRGRFQNISSHLLNVR